MFYLDHAATSPLRPEARAAMLAQMGEAGNASAIHQEGRRARAVVDEARETIAGLMDCRAAEVVFTSGGTEADNLAVKGMYWARRAEDQARRVVAVADTEHHAVLDAVEWLAESQGAEIIRLPLNPFGAIDVDAAAELLRPRAAELALVTCMYVNNETGVVHPVEKMGALCDELGVPLHTDATQAFGHLPLTLASSGAVAATITSHKVAGPIGIGALVLRADQTPVPVLHGGGQERKIRSGTLDPVLSAGFAAAAAVAVGNVEVEARRHAELRDTLAQRLQDGIPGLEITGPPIDPAERDRDLRSWRRAGHILHVTVEGCAADALLFLLDRAGIYCSAGSACTAGVQQGSHVTRAMGLPQSRWGGELRFSFGSDTSMEHIDAVAEKLPGIVKSAREFARREGTAG